jgi:hypothetical protein
MGEEALLGLAVLFCSIRLKEVRENRIGDNVASSALVVIFSVSARDSYVGADFGREHP